MQKFCKFFCNPFFANLHNSQGKVQSNSKSQKTGLGGDYNHTDHIYMPQLLKKERKKESKGGKRKKERKKERKKRKKGKERKKERKDQVKENQVKSTDLSLDTIDSRLVWF